eukprot:NODE_71_length_24927_cov_1.205937.p8 type:complete len:350 gc:universal NODE_71_length_24927_cov_1.205937:18141-19190(+)
MATPLNLPEEIILNILRFNPRSMFLLNKDYTKKYLMPKYAKVYYQKNCIIPIFKKTTRRSVFRYEQWITNFGFFFHFGKYSRNDFACFKYLTRCYTFDIFVRHSELPDQDFMLSFDGASMDEIIEILNNINTEYEEFHTLLKKYDWKKLSGLHALNLGDASSQELKNLTRLSLFYANCYELENLYCPNIKELKIHEFESVSIDCLHKSFPNLEYLKVGANDAIKCTELPAKLKALEVSFIHNNITLPSSFKTVEHLTVKVPYPHFDKTLLDEMVRLTSFNLVVGRQLAISNRMLFDDQYRLFSFSNFTVGIVDVKYTCDTAMVKQLMQLIGVEKTLEISKLISSRIYSR